MNTPFRKGSPQRPSRETDTETLNADTDFNQEIQRLAAINQELLGGTRTDPNPGFNMPDELTLLREENALLRARVEELEQVLQTAPPGEDNWAERQREYESLVEEKSEVIRALHMKIQELQEGGGAAPAGTAGSAANNSEVQQVMKELEEQRHQLELDEQEVMKQMRQMEMAMSKDRAELARQRNEVQRLHTELNREIELASRDPGLRERLLALQRLQGEVTGRKQATPATPPPPTRQPPAQKPAEDKTPPKKESSGLLRRFFGK